MSDARRLTFRVGDRRLSLPAVEVESVARRPPVTRVPHAAPAVEGVANLSGRVTAVVSTARAIGAQATPGGGQRLIVLRRADPTALSVDAIEELGEEAAGSEALDIEAALEPIMATASARAPRGRARSLVKAAHAAEQRLSVLEFEVAEQTFGLPLEQVLAVARAPERIVPVPDAEAVLLGVIEFGNALLPVLSAAALLGIPDGRGRFAAHLLILQLGAARLGLMVERVTGILRVARDRVSKAPGFLNRTAGEARIASIVRAPGRLVSILNPEAMLRPENVARLAAESVPRAASSSADEAETRAEPYLIFRLGAERYGLLASAIEEVSRVQAPIRLPHAPDFLVGVVMHRGRVLPLLDMRIRLATPDEGDARRLAIVVRGESGSHGLIVDSAEGVVSVSEATRGETPPLRGDGGELFPQSFATKIDGEPVLLVDPRVLNAQAARDVSAARADGAARATRALDAT